MTLYALTQKYFDRNSRIDQPSDLSEYRAVIRGIGLPTFVLHVPLHDANSAIRNRLKLIRYAKKTEDRSE